MPVKASSDLQGPGRWIAATYSVPADKIRAANSVVTTTQSMAGVHSLAILAAVSPDFTAGDGLPLLRADI
jgi:hypothetical protein